MEKVKNFEGDNIKTQHGGKGSVFFSVPGFSFGLSAEYNKTLVRQGKTRDVEGEVNAPISRNVQSIENAHVANKMMNKARGSGNVL